MAKCKGVLLRIPYTRPKSEIYTPKQDDEHPYPFDMGVSPPLPGLNPSALFVTYFLILGFVPIFYVPVPLLVPRYPLPDPRPRGYFSNISSETERSTASQVKSIFIYSHTE